MTKEQLLNIPKRKWNESLENVRAEIDSIKISDSKDELYKDILEMRYIFGYKWDDIVPSIHYCYDYVFRLHREALKFVFN